MGYSAVSFGEYEAALGLFNALAEYSLNLPRPRSPARNLQGRRQELRRTQGSRLTSSPTRRLAGLTVGVTAAVGPTVTERIKDDDGGTSSPTAPHAGGRPARRWTPRRSICASCSTRASPTAPRRTSPRRWPGRRAYPQFHVVLCLSDSDEPPGEPLVSANRLNPQPDDSVIVSLGHKGKYVGVVGVYLTGNPEKPL